MSNKNGYFPIPTRTWYRVQNNCFDLDSTYYGNKLDMLKKGNVLQYKANSSNLTKTQKYSLIAKGQWTNRNTTWASQSTRGFTNPNTTSLKRSGNVVNVAIDPITGQILGPTTEPPSCPKPIIKTNEALPSNGGGGSDVSEPNLPPQLSPQHGSNVFPPPVAPSTPPAPIVIQDGGVLICSVQENICTGKSQQSSSQQLCHPTTDSDVPGKIEYLCWNDGSQTWYPRQRYIMSNSTDKWPVNAKLVGAIKLVTPIITNSTYNELTKSVKLIWTFDDSCLPASSFSVFENLKLVKIVPGNELFVDISVANSGLYEYYIIAENKTAEIISEKSNIVSIIVS